MNDAPWQLIRRLEDENDQLTAEVAEYRAANTRMQELVVIRAKERDDALFSAEQRTAEVERLKAANDRARKVAIVWASIPDETDPPDRDDEEQRELGRIMLGLLRVDREENTR